MSYANTHSLSRISRVLSRRESLSIRKKNKKLNGSPWRWILCIRLKPQPRQQNTVPSCRSRATHVRHFTRKDRRDRTLDVRRPRRDLWGELRVTCEHSPFASHSGRGKNVKVQLAVHVSIWMTCTNREVAYLAIWVAMTDVLCVVRRIKSAYHCCFEPSAMFLVSKKSDNYLTAHLPSATHALPHKLSRLHRCSP
jgi:hypothetical protein